MPAVETDALKRTVKGIHNKNERQPICIRSGKSPGELSRQNDRPFRIKRVPIRIQMSPAFLQSNTIIAQYTQLTTQFIICRSQVLDISVKSPVQCNVPCSNIKYEHYPTFTPPLE